MRTARFLPAALALAAAGAGALTTSHVVIRQVTLPAMACEASTMGFIALNSFAVTSLCSAYVSCDSDARAGGGSGDDPVEFLDLADTARDQARQIDCVGVCRCLPRPGAAATSSSSSSREPVAVVANGTETRVVNATTVARSFDA